MSYSNIDVTTKNFITIIKINREKAFNALNEETIIELNTAIENVSKSQDTRVVIITGTGSKAFIAGADITMFQNNPPIRIRKVILMLQAVLNKIEDLKVPVI
ncbi:MAG: enoyl-CoA hydratase/isomerase family protein, partial [Candidatus Hodarchaeales archaeon]